MVSLSPLPATCWSAVAGYKDTNDAERLGQDRAMWLILRWPGPENLKRLVRHARRLVFQLAEVAEPRPQFQGVLERIDQL